MNTLSPGGVVNTQTNFFIENFSRRTSLGRMVEPTDYQNTIGFLTSYTSVSMTGTTLVEDAGWTCW